MATPDARRRLGLIFVGSATLMLGLALVFGVGLLPVTAPARYLVAGALAAAGAVELVLGIKFLGTGS